MSPYLADSSTEFEDGKQITFKLKPDLTCHDGSPLTAEDVAFTLPARARTRRDKFTGSTAGFVFTSLGLQGRAGGRSADGGDRDRDDYNPIALGLITEVKIDCKDSYDAHEPQQATQTPVGSGPYRFVEWVKSDHITLERLPGFTLRQAKFDRIVFRVIPEASTRAAELMAGNVDVITNVSPDQIDTVNGSANAKVQSVSGTRRMYVGFNRSRSSTRRAAMAIRKPEVRRALQYAVDVPTICEQLLRSCKRATDLVNPPNGNPTLKPYPYDPGHGREAARRGRLQERPDGVRFDLTLQGPNGRYLNDKNVALAIGQYLTDVGVKTDVEFMEWASVYLPLIRAAGCRPAVLPRHRRRTWNALYDMADLSRRKRGRTLPNGTIRWFVALGRLQRKQPEAEQQKVDQRDAAGLPRRRAVAAAVLPAGFLRREQPPQLARAPRRAHQPGRRQRKIEPASSRARDVHFASQHRGRATATSCGHTSRGGCPRACSSSSASRSSPSSRCIWAAIRPTCT